jgi:hypothetical protein
MVGFWVVTLLMFELLALSRYGSIEVFGTEQGGESSEDYKASGAQGYTKHYDRSKTLPY